MKNLKKHWYVVGHRAGARIFEQVGAKSELNLIHEFKNPDGHLKDSQLVSDRQGRADRSNSPGRTTLGSDVSPREHILGNFVRDVGVFLEREAEQNAFDSLVIVAEPHVLGQLNKAIGHPASDRLQDPIIKDLVHVSDRDMAAQLKDLLCVREEIAI